MHPRCMLDAFPVSSIFVRRSSLSNSGANKFVSLRLSLSLSVLRLSDFQRISSSGFIFSPFHPMFLASSERRGKNCIRVFVQEILAANGFEEDEGFCRRAVNEAATINRANERTFCRSCTKLAMEWFF